MTNVLAFSKEILQKSSNEYNTISFIEMPDNAQLPNKSFTKFLCPYYNKPTNSEKVMKGIFHLKQCSQFNKISFLFTQSFQRKSQSENFKKYKR